MSSKNGGMRSDEMQQLPDEIMYLIIGKLLGFPTYLARFSAVCKHWRRLLCTAWPELVDQIPPVALIPVVDPKDKEKAGLCDLIGGYVSSLPYGANRIIGASFGWLIITDMKEESVSLFNPFSKSHIRLPPFLFPDYPRYLIKGVLSKPPLEEENPHFDIAITMDPDYWLNKKTVGVAKMIAFLHVEKIDDELLWVYGECDDGILDVNSIGGRICILYSNGNICCLNCNSSSYYYGVRKEWDSFMVLNGDHLVTVHLIESSSSQPLVVFRYIDYGAYMYPTTVVGFKILSLTCSTDDDDEMNKTWNWTEDNDKNRKHEDLLNWTEIKTCDNDVLFISEGSSICVQTASKQHQHASSIYLSYDQTNFCVYNMDQNYLTLFPNRLLVDTNFLQRKPTRRLAGQPFWLNLSSHDLKFSTIH